jgi:hypothetical protein
VKTGRAAWEREVHRILDCAGRGGEPEAEGGAMSDARVHWMVLALAASATAALATQPAADPFRRLEAELDALPAVTSWPLRDVLVKALPPPPDVHIFPLAEVYHGDRAVLLAVGVRDSTPGTARFAFRRDAGGWQLVEELRGWPAAQKLAFEGPGETRIVRRAGLPMDLLPVHLQYVVGAWPRRMQAAAEARDWKRWGSLFERAMAGMGLGTMDEALSIQKQAPETIDAVRLVRQQPQGALVLAEFDIVQESRSMRKGYLLAREGRGWVLADHYVPPVTLTVVALRPLAAMLGAYAADHGDTFPAAGELGALEPLLVPAYGRAVPVLDAWATPLKYVRSADGKSFRIVSAGADKTFKPETWSLTGSYTDPAEDIVIDDTGTVLRQWQASR